MRRRLAILIVAAATALPALAQSAERFPPPEFAFNYQFPDVTVPGARGGVFVWLDVVVLVLTLGLAAWLVLRRRSRLEILGLTVFALLYFGFYRAGCVCPIGAIQNVALAIGSPQYALPITVGPFFVLPLGFALLFGRVFCAAVCPLGAAQEVVAVRPLRVPIWLERGLGIIPFVYLGVAGLFAWTNTSFLICRYDPYVAFFRLGGLTYMLIAGGVLLAVGVFIGRPYCRFLCPLGAIFRVLSPLAAWHVKLGGEDCVKCHLCADACPYNAIRPPTAQMTQPPSTGRRTMGVILLVLPLAIGLGAWLGYYGSDTLAGMNRTVKLSARAFTEQEGVVQGTTQETQAFYAQGEPAGGLFRDAAEVRRRFEVGSTVLGGFIGLVVGLQLVAVSLRRRRDNYEIDSALCVSCGRCFSSCPIEVARKSGRTVEPLERVT